MYTKLKNWGKICKYEKFWVLCEDLEVIYSPKVYFTNSSMVLKIQFQISYFRKLKHFIDGPKSTQPYFWGVKSKIRPTSTNLK